MPSPEFFSTFELKNAILGLIKPAFDRPGISIFGQQPSRGGRRSPRVKSTQFNVLLLGFIAFLMVCKYEDTSCSWSYSVCSILPDQRSRNHALRIWFFFLEEGNPQYQSSRSMSIFAEAVEMRPVGHCGSCSVCMWCINRRSLYSTEYSICDRRSDYS